MERSEINNTIMCYLWLIWHRNVFFKVLLCRADAIDKLSRGYLTEFNLTIGLNLDIFLTDFNTCRNLHK